MRRKNYGVVSDFVTEVQRRAYVVSQTLTRELTRCLQVPQAGG